MLKIFAESPVQRVLRAVGIGLVHTGDFNRRPGVARRRKLRVISRASRRFNLRRGA